MTIQIGSVAIPTTLLNRGTYTPPKREVLGQNGRGADVVTRTYSARFQYNTLQASQYAFWNTLLGGEPSKTFNSGTTTLYNHLVAEENWSSLTVALTFDKIKFGSVYENVVVELRNMVPATSSGE